jgi:translation initiation factor IF-2
MMVLATSSMPGSARSMEVFCWSRGCLKSSGRSPRRTGWGRRGSGSGGAGAPGAPGAPRPGGPRPAGRGGAGAGVPAGGAGAAPARRGPAAAPRPGAGVSFHASGRICGTCWARGCSRARAGRAARWRRAAAAAVAAAAPAPLQRAPRPARASSRVTAAFRGCSMAAGRGARAGWGGGRGGGSRSPPRRDLRGEWGVKGRSGSSLGFEFAATARGPAPGPPARCQSARRSRRARSAPGVRAPGAANRTPPNSPPTPS